MFRSTLVTAALTAGMVAGTAGVASAHECFIANRSATGNAAAAAHSSNWATLELAELYAHAHQFLSTPGEPLPALTPGQIEQAVGMASDQGVPTSFTIFERGMLPRSVEKLEQITSRSGDGKGVDHFFVAYGETIIGIYFAVAFPGGQVSA